MAAKYGSTAEAVNASDPTFDIPAFLRRGEASDTPLAHSPLAPSASERWMACPGSVRLSASSNDSSSDASRQGSAAHFLASECLESGTDAWEHAGRQIISPAHGAVHWRGGENPDDYNDTVPTVGEFYEVDDDMVVAVQQYVDHCRGLMDGADEYLIEFRYDMSDLYPYAFGTSDFAAVKDGRLYIVDYKHGVGVVVEAEDNTQLRTYAAGVIHHLSATRPELAIDNVMLTIVQPRAAHPGGPVRCWSTSYDEMGEWVSQVLVPKAMAALKPDAPLVPGTEQCRFCPGRLTCPAQQVNLGVVAAIAETAKEPGSLSDEDIGALLQQIDAIRPFEKALRDEAFTRLQKGKAIPGYKLVQQKATRVWKEGAEPELKAALGDAIYSEPVLRTPPQIEKLRGGKDLVARLAYKPESGVTMAAESDNRAAVKPRTGAEVFADIG